MAVMLMAEADTAMMTTTTAGPEIGTIVQWLYQRRSNMGRLLQEMKRVIDTYNGEIAIPLPELDSDEEAAVTNLLHQGVDGTAQRIASTLPDVRFPSVRPGFRRWDDEATVRRQVTLGWWEMNGMRRIMYRRARHLISLTMSPVMIRPDRHRQIPEWFVREPMSTYPAPSTRVDEIAPSDCIFTFSRPLSWLRREYPAQAARLAPADTDGDTLFECVEFVDAEVIVMGVVGQGGAFGTSPTLGSQAGAYRDTRDGRAGRQRFGVVGGAGSGWSDAEELERYVNRAQMCTAVVPGRITLDRLQGQFDGMIGKYIRQARLDALELRAIEEGIFPRQWLVGRPNERPKVVTVANGRKGILGRVEGGEIITQQLAPGYKTSEASDRLTMAQRQEGGVPSDWGGEAGTNIRTGRRGDQILAAQVDFPIQEHQVILEASCEHEIRVAIAVRKGWFGGAPSSFYVDWKGARGYVDVKAGDFGSVFATDRNVVKYSMAGSDLNGMIVRVGQKVGMGLWSKQTAREQDPETDDAELEHRRTITEGLEGAMLSGLEQQTQAGAVLPADVAKLMIQVRDGREEFPEAVVALHAEVQQRQATQAPPGAPETQLGLGGQAAGAQAGVAIPPPGPSLQDLNQRLSQLGRARTAISAGQKSGVFVPQGGQ